MISDYESAANLSGTIDFFDPLEIKWQISAVAGTATEWKDVGTSKNQAYATLNSPAIVSGLLLHTLVHLACKSAKGLTAPTLILDAIWANFADPIVVSGSEKLKRVDGTPLRYYNPHATSNVEASTLIRDGNGQCGSFAHLLLELLRVHGITHTTFDPSSTYNYIFIYPSAETSPFAAPKYGFLVREWSYAAGPGKSSDPAFPYLNLPRGETAQEYLWWYSQVTDLGGIPGQGSPNPRSLFNNHQFVQLNGKWYDASYGVIYTGVTESDRIMNFQGYLIGLYFGNGDYTVSEMSLDYDFDGDGAKDKTYRGFAFLIKNMPGTISLKVEPLSR